MIIWDYVKGLNAEGDSYTFIQFPKHTVKGNKSLPHLYVTNKNSILEDSSDTSKWTDLGKLQTSKDSLVIENLGGKSDLYLWLSNIEKAQRFIISTTDQALCSFDIQPTSNYEFRVLPSAQFDVNLNVNKTITLGEPTTITLNGGNGTIHSTGSITTNNKCEALYFNATSDERAKENFIYVPRAHALEWINNLNIYTFNYRDNGKSSIGITTQQIQNKPINNFNFVDNLKATGENGDYMTIKESKLVYMCMSAIQELSQQNIVLQEKLAVLEDEFKNLKK